MSGKFDDRLSFSGIDDNMPKKTDKQRLDSFNNHTIIKKPFVSHPSSKNKTHVDSGFAGPLLIYENDKPQTSDKTINETDLQNLHMESSLPSKNIITNSSHFHPPLIDNNADHPPYQQLGGYISPWGNNPNKINSASGSEGPVKPISDSSDQSPPYMGPFNPDFKATSSSKPKKGNKTSTSSNNSNKQKGDRVRPPLVIPQSNIPYQQSQYNTVHRPEEILQIINQHPELANYPSGSVFEIHNYDPNVKYPDNPRLPPGLNSVNRPPYLMNQVDPGMHFNNNNNNNYPNNYPIDQIIKHVQNGQLPPGLARPPPSQPVFGQTPPYAQNPSIYAPHGLQFPLINGQPQLKTNQTSGGIIFKSFKHFHKLLSSTSFLTDFPGFPNVPGSPYQSSPGIQL